MTCAKPSDCAPCRKCPESPPPVLPRCDIPLNDGVYANATIVVEDGCIIEVQQGTPLLYQPDNNCAGSGTGGEGTPGLQGAQGIPGLNATISIAGATALPPGSAPTVVNLGTPTNASLQFGIPAGEPGENGEDATGATVTAAGIIFEDGALQEPLPPAWPPVLDVIPQPVVGSGVTLSRVKNPTTGAVELTLDVSALITYYEGLLSALAARVTTLEATAADHETRITALEPP